MITLKDADGIPVSWRRRLEDLAARYPVGVKVRHESGWTGTVAADHPGNIHGLDLAAAHGIAMAPLGRDGVVCVHAVIQGYPVTSWYRPEVLTLVGKGAPAPRPAPRPASPASAPAAAPRPARRRTRRAA